MLTDRETYYFDKIELIIKTIDDLRKEQALLIKKLGSKRYNEILIEKFEEKLKKFVETNKYFSNYDFWFNENLETYCVSFNFDEDNTADKDWDVLNDFIVCGDYYGVLFTSNHRLF